MAQITAYNEPNIISPQHIITVSYEEPTTVLQKHWDQLVISQDTRTIWYQGYPYGTSYQFAPKGSNVSGDVFGDATGHSLNGTNEFVSGTCNVAYGATSAVFGSYNKYKATTVVPGESYIFCIGNGISTSNRSNALTVTKGGNVTAYEIAYTKLDTSYVTSLGQAADMNTVLKALLEAAKYYKPTFAYSCSAVETAAARNALVGTAFTSFGMQIYWASNKPQYETDYIYKYITENKALPSGVALSMLGYTDCLTNSASGPDNYSSNINYSINIYISATVNTPIPITYPKLTARDSSKLVPIYTDKFFKISNANLYTFNAFAVNKPGYFELINTALKIYYNKPQINYFPQLVQNGVYVQSDSAAWSNGQVYSLPIRVPVYFGYYFIHGIFTSNTDYETIPDSLIIDAMNNKTGGTGALTNVKMFYNLVTNKYNLNYLPASKSWVYFGSKKMGNISEYSDGKIKYFLIAFPTNYYMPSQKDGKTGTAVTEPIEFVPGENMSSNAIACQRKLETTWTHSTYTAGKGINYTVWAGKINASTIYFSDETESKPNVRVIMNQQNLGNSAM